MRLQLILPLAAFFILTFSITWGCEKMPVLVDPPAGGVGMGSRGPGGAVVHSAAAPEPC